MSDVSKEALVVAEKNRQDLNMECNIILSDLFENIDGKFDCIVSNPPYIKTNEEIEDIVKNNEPHLALYAGEDGLYFYNEILKNIKPYLNDKFLIAFEIGYMQGDAIRDLAFRYLNDVKVSIEKDYNDKDRYVFIWNN